MKEIELTPKVKERIANLVNQQQQVKSQIEMLVSIFLEGKGVEILEGESLEISSDLSKLIIKKG